MLDYAYQRAIETLEISHRAVLVTNGPAGVLASEFPCEAVALDLYLLVPQTSDHLFNLENDAAVTLLTARCELKGKAQILARGTWNLDLSFWRESGAEWCVLVRVELSRMQIRGEQGWENLETIDL